MADWRLRQLPVSARFALSCFLAMIGAGYILALANIYYSHRAADGDASALTLNDVRAVYSGLTVEVKGGQPVPSRMLEMVDTQMRDFLKTEADYQTLRNWLASGAKQETFTTVAAGSENSPESILTASCVRCHTPDGERGEEEAHRSPFAADIFSSADFAMVSKYTATTVDETTGTAKLPPQSIERLVLVGHIHMLTIPVFTLITSLLAAFTGLRPGMKGVLVATPMLVLVIDFAGWFLARSLPGAIWLIVGSGPVFGVFFALQILAAFFSMWWGRRVSE